MLTNAVIFLFFLRSEKKKSNIVKYYYNLQ